MIVFNLSHEKALDSLKTSLEKDNLSELYVNLDNETPSNVKEVFLVSYFDHILTEDEYMNEQFVCYANIVKLNDRYFDEKFTTIANEFLYIYQRLFDLNDGFVYIDANSSIIKTKNSAVYARHIINGLKERPTCCLVFQNLKLVVDLGFDLTHCFYCLDDSKIKQIKEMILSTNLFILQP